MGNRELVDNDHQPAPGWVAATATTVAVVTGPADRAGTGPPQPWVRPLIVDGEAGTVAAPAPTAPVGR